MDSYHDLFRDMAGWRMAGAGGFRPVCDGTIESFGGSGLFWYENGVFEDFLLSVEWRLTNEDDNSGVFLRCPPLSDDIRPAIEQGYEVQIDDRGFDPERQAPGSPLHLTGAIYKLAPATRALSHGAGEWNIFEVTAVGQTITVRLNGMEASKLELASRSVRGHVALQSHHDGSAVQFRNLRVLPIQGQHRRE